MAQFLDSPIVTQIAFHRRVSTPHISKIPNVIDGTIPIAGTQHVLGFRFYPLADPSPSTPVIIYFHGNAEVRAYWRDEIVAIIRINNLVFGGCLQTSLYPSLCSP